MKYFYLDVLKSSFVCVILEIKPSEYTASDRDICYMPVVPQTNSSVMILRMINDTENILCLHFSLYPQDVHQSIYIKSIYNFNLIYFDNEYISV